MGRPKRETVQKTPKAIAKKRTTTKVKKASAKANEDISQVEIVKGQSELLPKEESKTSQLGITTTTARTDGTITSVPKNSRSKKIKKETTSKIKTAPAYKRGPMTLAVAEELLTRFFDRNKDKLAVLIRDFFNEAQKLDQQ